MKTSIIWAAVAAVALTACADVPATEPMSCWMHDQFEKVGLAYEERHNVALTEAEWECLHGIGVAWVPAESFYDYCGSGSLACYMYQWTEGNRKAIVFNETVLRSWQTGTIQQRADFTALVHHEALHRLLDCVEGDPSGNHSHPDFDDSTGDHMWGGPDSLMRVSQWPESAYVCDEPSP